MKKLLTLCLLAVTMCAVAQEQTQAKRIAILETVDKTDKVDYAYELQLRQNLTFAINRTPGYRGYNRLDMAQINSEHNFQRTGFVSDADIKKLGQMAGAEYVLIAEVTPYSGGKLMILANLVNVESGEIENSTPTITSAMDDISMAEACKKIAQLLLNVPNEGEIYSSLGYSNGENMINHWMSVTCNIGITKDMVWKRLLEVVNQYFDTFETCDMSAGKIKTASRTTCFATGPEIRIRFEAYIMLNNDAELTYQVCVFSDIRPTPYDEWEKYPNVMSKYEAMLNDLKSLSSNM